MDNEFILEDRLAKIASVIQKYGEDNFCLSFSGGKDSTVLHYLLDLAIPNNSIPRVFIDTGIEYHAIVEFVKFMQCNDNRIDIIKPTHNIKKTLDMWGYPFKSKEHSAFVYQWYHGKMCNSALCYLRGYKQVSCPQILKYQFKSQPPFLISDKCCDKLKKEPFIKYQKDHNKPYKILGIKREERGNRTRTKCLVIKSNKLKSFNPLAVINNEWMSWFIYKYNIKLCDLYYAPYNFKRTGCKGCPFNPNLQEDINILKKYFPSEYKQCELIWKPVYDEYRRINYRLKK